jgi:hypothetical protein
VISKFEVMRRLLAAVKRLMEPQEPKRRPLMQRSVPNESGVVKNEITVLPNEKPSNNFFGSDCNLTKN